MVVVVVGLEALHLYRYGLEYDSGPPTHLLTTVPSGEVKTGTRFASSQTHCFPKPGGWEGCSGGLNSYGCIVTDCMLPPN